MRIAAIILAAGQGKRMGLGKNKQFLELNGKPLVVHTLERWQAFAQVNQLVVVVGKEEIEQVQQLIQKYALDHVQDIVVGGKERQDSVYQGLCALKSIHPDLVLIHDGARPFVQQEQIERLVDVVIEQKAAVLAVPVKDTIKKVDTNQSIVETLNRDTLWAIQTPQGFAYELILQAHEQARHEKIVATDDAALVERLGHRVRVVQGHEHNLKLTTPEDIELANLIITKQN